jgi:hypothetical protein
LSGLHRVGDEDPPTHLRATYSFELGTWKATCRACGWQVSDPNRRRAAARFRLHHKDPAYDPGYAPLTVVGDGGDDSPPAVLLEDRG